MADQVRGSNEQVHAASLKYVQDAQELQEKLSTLGGDAPRCTHEELEQGLKRFHASGLDLANNVLTPGELSFKLRGILNEPISKTLLLQFNGSIIEINQRAQGLSPRLLSTETKIRASSARQTTPSSEQRRLDLTDLSLKTQERIAKILDIMYEIIKEAAGHRREDIESRDHVAQDASPYMILYLASNPEGTEQLALDQEAREIEEKLRMSKHRDRFILRTRWAVRTDDLLQAFNEHKPAIVHFSGHGVKPGIFLQDSTGFPTLVSSRVKTPFLVGDRSRHSPKSQQPDSGR
jgi:hypothetical protein